LKSRHILPQPAGEIVWKEQLVGVFDFAQRPPACFFDPFDLVCLFDSAVIRRLIS